MKNIFEKFFQKNTTNKPKEELTMPKPEHEGYKDFTIKYKGDISTFTIKRSLYDEFLNTAEQRNCRASDLLRAGLDKYGLEDNVFEKIINEKEKK